MKKIIYTIMYLVAIILMIFSIKSNAVSLDTINIKTDKQNVQPGENVVLSIEFGKNLGAYTFDIAYDKNIFEYVSTNGGTANDTGTKVRVYYFDSTGGSSPRTNMSITFKAKAGITTSNPTNFSITAEGMANEDASTNYDDISIPIVKDVVVEPKYEDYNIALTYTGTIIPNKEKDMKLTVSSKMGKYYDHARIIAEATTPTGATVKILGTDEQGLEHDIIQSGWGDASGYAIGGMVNQNLSLRGTFSEKGEYKITIKLIDRDSSDAIIASKTFNIVVAEENTNQGNTNQGNTNQGQQKPNQNTNNTEEKLPSKLPQTGYNEYVLLIPIMLLVAILYIKASKKD